MKRRWNKMTEHEKQEFSDSVRKYPINHNAFDKLSADSNYWIGYIMARGSISKSRPRVRISVLKKDRTQLDRFKEFIYPKKKAPIGYDNEKKGVYEFDFSSSRIVNELERRGIHYKMGYHQKVILLENDKDFWRGFIDGNGTFEPPSKRDNTSIRIIKGPELILQFKAFAEKILRRTIGDPKHEVKNSSLTLYNRVAVELYKILLYDKNSIALDSNLEWMNRVLSLSKYKTIT